MAARRTRIKGIANIPQRRKNESATLEVSTKQDELGSDSCSNQTLPDAVPTVSYEKSSIATTDLVCEPINTSTIVPINPSPPPIVNETNSTQSNTETAKETAETVLTNNETSKISAAVPFKRRFAKPIISASLINKRTKPKLEDIPSIVKSTVDLSEAQSYCSVIESIANNKKDPPLKSVHFALNETEIVDKDVSQNVNKVNEETSTNVPGIKLLPKSINSECTKSNSDTEYPQAPPSPTKFNRTRIKAVPRLGQRRTSFSASESEDDNRKSYNRQRNDSVCSTASDHQSNIEAPSSPKKELNIVIQKKWRRTEQSRKLAEARREFMDKFRDAKPDRQKLTMMDLIFYNPTTNPMSQKRKRKSSSEMEKEPEVQQTNAAAEPEEVASTSDEENAIPAPQIKIGADGEIVIDEKSLVIENKEVKKNREQIQKSSLVDGDFDTKYGVYKKVKRSKCWTRNETLQFYKALNTIGTDFTLMCELFPNRTRKELTMKFKKEERMNRTLVDKAVMQPSNFDITELKYEMEIEEREIAEREKLKKEKQELAKKKSKPTKKDEQIIKKPVRRNLSKRKTAPNMHKALNEGITSLLSDSDADESDISTNSSSDSSDSVIRIVEPQPTRSGRIPKLRQPTPEFPVPVRRQYTKKTKESTQSDNPPLDPGSVVIFTSVGASGEPVYKVFMVTPDKDKPPLNLNGTMLENLTKSLDNSSSAIVNAQTLLTISAQENCAVPLEENNVTIPAEESNVTPLAIENNVTIPAGEDMTMRPVIINDDAKSSNNAKECETR